MADKSLIETKTLYITDREQVTYEQGATHQRTEEHWRPPQRRSRQGCEANAARKVHVGSVDPVLHILRPDPAEKR